MRPDLPARRPVWLVLSLPVLVLVALLSVALYRVGASIPEFHGTAYEPPAPATDFTLTEHSGRQLRLSDLRGTPVLLFFGYTHCPDVCPMTLARLRRALDAVDAGPDEIRVLLVTVDPARDTPEELARYVARFGPGVSGLTGSPEELSTVYRAYGIHAEPGSGPEGHDKMMHTSAVMGIDREGQLRVLLHPTDPNAPIEDDIRTLLAL